MEVFRPLAETGLSPDGVTTILAAPGSADTLVVELSLERHVYLQEARLVLLHDSHAEIRPVSFSDPSTAAWRHVEFRGDPVATGFSVQWTAIANAAPGATYVASLAVRDAGCTLLAGLSGHPNPLRVVRRIGPADNPTDVGQLRWRLGRAPADAGSLNREMQP